MLVFPECSRQLESYDTVNTTLRHTLMHGTQRQNFCLPTEQFFFFLTAESALLIVAFLSDLG